MLAVTARFLSVAFTTRLQRGVDTDNSLNTASLLVTFVQAARLRSTQAMSSASTVLRMRERDDDSGDAPAPTSHAPLDCESNESAVTTGDSCCPESTTSETNPLEYLPEEWQALGRKFAFTYTTSFT